ncbi:MAG: molybdopterin-dependent oxidoreductase [Planctomycetia bacterium]|nr:molybdopterin-dependent oxidoreductase [Planctomycetia bacterium]
MNANNSLRVDGLVERALALNFDDLRALPEADQVRDVRRLGAKRGGDAVGLATILRLAGASSEAQYITLHAGADDFHASVPLSSVSDKAVLIYQQDGAPLPAAAGGPFRFFIPDHAACRTAEIDECANVKFVDRIELTRERGFDNRPQDETEHAKLHEPG